MAELEKRARRTRSGVLAATRRRAEAAEADWQEAERTIRRLKRELRDLSWVLCGNCGRNYNLRGRGAEKKHGIGLCGDKR